VFARLIDVCVLGRFPVKDSYDAQLAGTMSLAEYNCLERITLYNIRRYYK